MSVNKLKISHKDGNSKTNSETFNTTLTSDIDSDTALAVDNWARSFVALSNDTYEDTEITSTQSINEILAGD